MAFRLSSGTLSVLVIIILFSTKAGCSGDVGSKAEKMAQAIWNKFMNEDMDGRGVKLVSGSQFKFFLENIKQEKTVDELRLHFQRDKAKAVVKVQKRNNVGEARITATLASITVKMDGEEQTVSDDIFGQLFKMHLQCMSTKGVLKTWMAISISARGWLKIGSDGKSYDCIDLLKEQMELAVFSKVKALLLEMPEGERCGESFFHMSR